MISLTDVKNFVAGLVTGVKDRLPDILMVTGTFGVVGGTAMACKATMKVPEIMDSYRTRKKAAEGEEDEKQKVRSLKLETAGKLVVNYLPSAVVEGLSLGGMWSGYGKMKGRYIGAATAYIGLHAGFERYRANVREEFGEETDERMMYGIRTETVKVTDEDGEETVQTIEVYPHDIQKMPSIYARYFAPSEAEGAENSLSYNLTFLQLQQDGFNRRFRARKKMMLYEVYEELGIKTSVASHHVGWAYDKSRPDGDNKIDLHIRLVWRDKLDDFGNPCGVEQVYMIDPNVDGMVEEKLVKLGLLDP